MPRKKKTDSAASANTGDSVTSIKYPAKRKNIPPAGLEAQGVLQEAPKIRYEYNPHLPPVLRSATDTTEADKLPELLATARQRALSAAEAKVLADALRRHEPWLEWSGKREKPWFEVEPVALHMHERISTQAILRVLAREDVERDLFADPQQDYAKAVQFYQHDMDWANRMIRGDSLQVMDVYDPVSNTLFPTDKERIAAWFLDTDYDGRTFCICQAFFPDKSKWDKLAKALSDVDVIEENAFEALSGLVSLPFPRPERLGKGET